MCGRIGGLAGVGIVTTEGWQLRKRPRWVALPGRHDGTDRTLRSGSRDARVEPLPPMDGGAWGQAGTKPECRSLNGFTTTAALAQVVQPRSVRGKDAPVAYTPLFEACPQRPMTRVHFTPGTRMSPRVKRRVTSARVPMRSRQDRSTRAPACSRRGRAAAGTSRPGSPWRTPRRSSASRPTTSARQEKPRPR